MKKFLMVTPQQPDFQLHLEKYVVQGNALLEYGETHFPVVPLINGYVDEGEEVQLITVTYDYKHCRTNFETLKTEIAALEEKRGIKCPIESLEVPFDDSVGALIQTFQLLIDRIDDGDILHACITFGSKPMPLVLVMAMQYAYRLRKNVSIECVVYGQIDRANVDCDAPREEQIKQEVPRIYDVTALVTLDELVRVLRDSKVEEPGWIISRFLEM